MPSPPPLPRARRRLLAAAVGVICLVPAGCTGPWDLGSAARAAAARAAIPAGNPTAAGSVPTLAADTPPAPDTSGAAPAGSAAAAANGRATAGAATGSAPAGSPTTNDVAAATAGAEPATTDAGGAAAAGDVTTTAAAPVGPTTSPATTVASAIPSPTTSPSITPTATPTASRPAAAGPTSVVATPTPSASAVVAGPTTTTTAATATPGTPTAAATAGAATTAAVDDQGYATSAAVRYGWGAPERDDEFSSGVGGDWALYDGPGHNGSGRRSPTAVTTAGGVMTITGNVTGTTEGMAWLPGRQYGRWETRIKTSAGDSTYHAVALLWPDAENWPVGGEVDFMENSDTTRQSTDMFLHYGADNSQVSSTVDLDATQWHDWAVEWTPDHLAAYVDGVEWFRTTETAKLPPGPMHLCLQLDWFPDGSTPTTPTTMAVDWARQYPV